MAWGNALLMEPACEPANGVRVYRRVGRRLAAAWDRLVPRDLPHLRSGFLRAVELGGMVQDPAYLMVYQEGRLAAVAVTYGLPMDTIRHAPEHVRQWMDRVRRRWPGFLWTTIRICGSPVSNGECGLHFDPDLSPENRRQALLSIVRAVEKQAGFNQSVFFKEFTAEQVASFAGALEDWGFFSVATGANTRLALPWNSFDAYVAAMRKHYRKLIKKDLDKGQELEIELLDSFAPLANQAEKLYTEVYSRAEHVVERATPEFFRAVSDFDQARLLVARDRATRTVLGVNLLLLGESVMQNLFIGIDYARNNEFHTYFNLVEKSLEAGMKAGCKVAFLGQDSYTFKARLGALPVPLTGYMKHRLWPVHRLLRSNREQFFPKDEPITYDVFQAK